MPSLPTLECTGCGACGQVCPKKAVSLSANDEGFLYPRVDSSLCVECGLCEKICPVNQTKKDAATDGNFSLRKSFACIAPDEAIRSESSSGGVFSVLAEKIVMGEGIVFGAEFDETFSVKHGWARDIEGVARFRGSKYLQSRTEDSFAACKKFLDGGLRVLYSGTPCQIAGLKAFLRGDYENLLTVDFICHGVPSPALWSKYKKYREKKSASRTVKTAFRRKNDGWKLYSLSFTFANESEYRQPLTKDKYLQLFLKDNALRESCYRCPFRGDGHKSDLTLADFWGVERVHPDFFDDKGTSLVIVQSEKGNAFFESCAEKLRRAETDFTRAVGFNPAYYKSPRRNKKRNSFYKNFDRHGIDFLYRRFGRMPLLARTVSFGKRAAVKLCRILIGNKNTEKLKSILRGEK